MDKMVLEGRLYNSEGEQVVIYQDDGRSVHLYDTLMRSPFLRMNVRITIELREQDEEDK